MITRKIAQQVLDKYIQKIQSLNLLPQEKSINDSNNIKISKILKILVGTCRSTRLGPKPLPDTLDIIRDNINLKIKNELPLNVAICFGCKKTWKLCQPGVDIAELFTLIQFLNLNRQIQYIYPPGINFNLYLGDAWYEYIYRENLGIKEYTKGWKNLLNLNNELKVTLISMYNFHKNNSKLYKICNENLELLKEYWDESSNTDEKNWQYLKSYKKLITVGWVGTIPNIMRIHYLKKTDRYLSNASRIEMEEAVLKYFSYGLMLNQYDLIKRKNSNDCTFEISVMSPPPGIPKRLRGNRIYLRSLPPEISSRGAPCWPVMGILRIDDQDSIHPSILSPRDWKQSNIQLVDKFDYTINKKSNFNITIPIYKTVA